MLGDQPSVWLFFKLGCLFLGRQIADGDAVLEPGAFAAKAAPPSKASKPHLLAPKSRTAGTDPFSLREFFYKYERAHRD